MTGGALHEEDIAAIRELFLERKESYRREDVRRLLRVTPAGLREILRAGHLAPVEGTHPPRYGWAEVVDCAIHERWTPRLVHDALGDDAPRVLPDSHRFASLTVRLPRYQLVALETLAAIQSRRTGVPVREDDVLERLIAMDADLAADQELEEAMPGFARYLRWPLSV